MRSNFIKVWQILSPKERHQLLLVLGLELFSGLIDMAAVASIFPFLSMATNPERLRSSHLLSALMNWTQLSEAHFLIWLGVFSLLVLILNQIVRIGSGWYGQVVSHRIWWALHRRMFRYYLNLPYSYHLQHSGNTLLEKLQVRTVAVVAGVINPLIFLASSFFSTFFVIVLLIWVNPIMTLALLGVMAGFYFLTYRKIKPKIDFYGKIGPEFSKKSFDLIAEAFGAIKEIKIRRNGQTYIDLFDPMVMQYCDAQVKMQLFSTMPGGMIEVVAFGGILLVCMFMIDASGLQSAIPLLGMYTIALRRIIPAIQDAYRKIAMIRFHQPSFQILQDDLINALPLSEAADSQPQEEGHLSLNREIELKELSFAYPGTSRNVLDSISLKIPAGGLIGIAGGSGAGKTTLVDLILGLFEPTSGNILIDGEPLNAQTLPKWQACLGYVQQSGFIADGTIARNIAFGIPEVQVDMQRVKEMARIAHISGFIESELPQQYQTMVGERGVRLSGGQRQRLGIARALYQDADVLILDEATSALDGVTEEKVMHSIRSLSGKKTVLLIAHRLTTLKECDIIFLFEDGKLIDQGTYQSLIDINPIFRRMARETDNGEAINSRML